MTHLRILNYKQQGTISSRLSSNSEALATGMVMLSAGSNLQPFVVKGLILFP